LLEKHPRHCPFADLLLTGHPIEMILLSRVLSVASCFSVPEQSPFGPAPAHAMMLRQSQVL